MIVLATGLLQLAMGALQLGRWFRAISVSVVAGHARRHRPRADRRAALLAGRRRGTRRRAGQDRRAARGCSPTPSATPTRSASLALGAGTIAVLVLWRRLPGAGADGARRALAAVGLATLAAAAARPAGRHASRCRACSAPSSRPRCSAFGELASVGLLGTIVAFTLIASAESLFSAAAVDRLHDGPRTEYDKELMAQGAGNTVCGLLGALPMTAVIVRSAANVQAGARTKASRVLHGVWLLLFAAPAARPRSASSPSRRWPASSCTRAASSCPLRTVAGCGASTAARR